MDRPLDLTNKQEKQQQLNRSDFLLIGKSSMDRNEFLLIDFSFAKTDFQTKLFNQQVSDLELIQLVDSMIRNQMQLDIKLNNDEWLLVEVIKSNRIKLLDFVLNFIHKIDHVDSSGQTVSFNYSNKIR